LFLPFWKCIFEWKNKSRICLTSVLDSSVAVFMSVASWLQVSVLPFLLFFSSALFCSLVLFCFTVPTLLFFCSVLLIIFLNSDYILLQWLKYSADYVSLILTAIKNGWPRLELSTVIGQIWRRRQEKHISGSFRRPIYLV